MATAVIWCWLLIPVCGLSQNLPGYDEISVTVNMQRIGSTEVPALIRNDTALLSVTDLFDFLKINNHPTPGFDSVQGYLMNPQAAFSIFAPQYLVLYKGKTYKIDSSALIPTATGLYLRSDYYSSIFELTCTFHFRSLSVLLTTSLELPIIREMRLAMMRSNMRVLRGELKADTIVHRQSRPFSFGMADWSVITRQHLKKFSETALNLTLGARVAGGETTVSLNYRNHEPFDERQQNYQWRLVDNSNPVLRQFIAGKYFSQSIASIYTPIVGVQITNTPTIYRRSFGTYNLSNITEPNWMVELYVNDALINYVQADASGFFSFEVPLVYGNSAVKLRFYGPFGEERTREGNIVIPFSFLPLHELNYSISAGIVEDGLGSRFSRAVVNYGLGRRITIGGGLEYLSSIRSRREIPFVQASMRLAANLMLTAELDYGVRTKGLLTYRRPSNLQVEINYARYKKGQQAILYNYLEERNLLVSVPLRTKNFAAFSRLTISQRILPKFRYTSGEMLLSVSAHGMSANLTTFTLNTTSVDPFVYTNLALNFRFGKFIVIPQVQYEYRGKRISMIKGQVDKQFSRSGYLTMSYERNYFYQLDNAGIGLRYDLAFAQTYFAVNRSNRVTSFTQSARGSLLYDQSGRTVQAGNRSSVGRGGVVLMPFLDINCNGRRDADEPKAPGLKLRMSSGNLQYLTKDTSVRLSNLEPYVQYMIVLDSNSFDNIAWRLRKKTYSVYIEANQFTLIEVPVAVAGEVSGTVYINDGKERKGAGRITVSIYNSDSVLVKRLLTESDGYFSYLGLPPGDYTARIDAEQMKSLQLIPSTPVLPFRIAVSKEGDVADGLEFVLRTR